MKRSKASVICGQSGFPELQTATINRIKALRKLLLKDGDVYILNRHPLFPKEQHVSKDEFLLAGHFGSYRSSNFTTRNLLKLASPFVELYNLVRLRLNYRALDIHIYTEHTALLLFYAAIAKLLLARAIHHYVELRSSIPKQGYRIIDHHAYDRLAPILLRHHIAISQSLKRHIYNSKGSGSARVIVVPPICSFSELSTTPPSPNDRRYFLFCGSSDYLETIQIVVRSYQSCSDLNGIELILVISGNNRERVEMLCKGDDRIEVTSNLPYSTLISLYRGAHALLIPLRDTPQDISRFPQKICEYLASGRPIITSPVGDIPDYFVKDKTAFIAKDCSIDAFAFEMSKVANCGSLVDEVGSEGYLIGMEKFNVDNIDIRQWLSER